jgi:hypothetical protein
MKYTKSERELFRHQIARFHAAYRDYMQIAGTRDTTVPIWHTYEFPEAFLQQIKQKVARCISTWAAAVNGEIAEEEAFQEFRAEMQDIVNYAAYCAAITEIFAIEEEEEGGPHVASSSVSEGPEAVKSGRRPPVPSGSRSRRSS